MTRSRAAIHVAVGIPAWHATTFVGATLASLVAQTHRNWSAVISVDDGDEATAAACAPFLTDARVRLVIQDRRLGWVGNCNAVLALASGDYIMLLPHDDLLAPSYLATLIAHAVAHPEAACVYCDIAVQGGEPLVQPSVCGPIVARQLTLLAGHMGAIAFRGLVRSSAFTSVGGLQENEADNYAADTVWMARLARVGELHRVARPLYEKRYHPANTHTTWTEWPVERQRRAWIVHCRDMLIEALACATNAVTRQALLTAAVGRVVAALPQSYPFRWLIDLDQPAQRTLAEDFHAAVAASAGLGLYFPSSTWHLVAPYLPSVASLDRLAADVARHEAKSEQVASELERAHADARRHDAVLAEHARELERLRALLATLSQVNALLTSTNARLAPQLLGCESEPCQPAHDDSRREASTS